MTKAELKKALDSKFNDDDVIVISDESGGWDNIESVGKCDGLPCIFFGGGSAFSDE